MISNLKQAIEFIHNHPQIKELKVPMKAYVRIRRDLKQLSFIIETPYTSVPKEYKWLWHEHKHMMRTSEVKVVGIRIVLDN